ncbi:hypothetical protein ZHAS_00022259 [Anopheles sinensis]|uniref:Uncharacterized protein n=1 Tax=Anopheles sinensis TaxID=74873 RepID=A0A084WUW1_ANOSI|nr:hypothetical protein ZHAS_00022259 [Anopheles sinensis]
MLDSGVSYVLLGKGEDSTEWSVFFKVQDHSVARKTRQRVGQRRTRGREGVGINKPLVIESIFVLVPHGCLQSFASIDPERTVHGTGRTTVTNIFRLGHVASTHASDASRAVATGTRDSWHRDGPSHPDSVYLLRFDLK